MRRLAFWGVIAALGALPVSVFPDLRRLAKIHRM
jgi:hypothetical protein